MINLNDFDTLAGSDEGAEMTLRNPATNEPIDGTWIRLAGPDSKIAKARKADIRRKLRRQRTNTLDLNMLEEEATETRVAITLAWQGIELNGPLNCTPENARMLYERFPWIAEQVDEFQGDRSNFLPSKSKG